MMSHLIPRWIRAQKLLIVLVIISLSLVTTLAACGSSGHGNTTNNGSSKGGNLVVGLNSDVVTLDPLKSSALVDRQAMLNMYDTLVGLKAQGQIVPDMPTPWTNPSPPQRVFTQPLGLTFCYATPFNAVSVDLHIHRRLTKPSAPRNS